jgi:hypothetical protein
VVNVTSVCNRLPSKSLNSSKPPLSIKSHWLFFASGIKNNLNSSSLLKVHLLLNLIVIRCSSSQPTKLVIEAPTLLPLPKDKNSPFKYFPVLYSFLI